MKKISHFFERGEHSARAIIQNFKYLWLALTVVLLIDGAEGLAHMGRLCFPTAIQIADFYHALEHAGKVLQALLGSKEHPDFKKRLGRWARQLLRDNVEHLIAAARKECPGTARAEVVEKDLGYFVRNVARMQYGTFRSRGFFIGSGVIEAGCKTIIGARCKQSGMLWGVAGAENILALHDGHGSPPPFGLFQAYSDPHLLFSCLQLKKRNPHEVHIPPFPAPHSKALNQQLPVRQGEVMVLRGWKSLKFGEKSPRV